MAAYTTIDDPTAYFKCHLYTGTGSSNAQTFADTDTDMQPDMVWIKNRDATDNHVLTDAVRGATKTLFPNYNDPSGEATVAEGLKSFDSDGYTVGTDVRWNTNTEDYVSWNWKMGTTSGLSGGSLTSDGYSFSATAGQGVYKYTGGGSTVTISHGLGAVPKFMIVKRLGNQEWRVYHVTPGPTKNLVLDQNDAQNTNSANWNNTAPTSSVFTVGTSLTESSFVNMVYVFADVQGYSKFGSYVGNNGGANGVFVYTGFRPSLVIQKAASAANGEWLMTDVKRNTYNLANTKLEADTTDAEFTDFGIDILSNGFKTKADGADQQDSGVTYVYAAFAEAPFVNSNGVPCNAR